jgi:hypothetical protein
MAKRDNHYEAAFEEYLRHRQVPYVAVDETRRSLMAAGSLKSLDFIVSSSLGGSWLIDVKGRRFPSGGQKQYWKNWSTQDDVWSLSEWERLFGRQFRGLLVFAYNICGDQAPVPVDQVFEFREHLYGFVAISLRDYVSHARSISARWNTVAMPVRRFRSLATPVEALL